MQELSKHARCARSSAVYVCVRAYPVIVDDEGADRVHICADAGPWTRAERGEELAVGTFCSR
ncbi:hypothetical protein BDN70DRAFT_883877 [Pholiota conissans]|uniref:Uncharacterized protein n=1 Tax=Pholiota conissans TaxID=109636 RepID=A0A9P5YVF6_9AGAR|nr:hypothetical protein BDN70DRAFT_883877 [Pholiota conissans]